MKRFLVKLMSLDRCRAH